MSSGYDKLTLFIMYGWTEIAGNMWRKQNVSSGPKQGAHASYTGAFHGRRSCQLERDIWRTIWKFWHDTLLKCALDLEIVQGALFINYPSLVLKRWGALRYTHSSSQVNMFDTCLGIPCVSPKINIGSCLYLEHECSGRLLQLASICLTLSIAKRVYWVLKGLFAAVENETNKLVKICSTQILQYHGPVTNLWRLPHHHVKAI